MSENPFNILNQEQPAIFGKELTIETESKDPIEVIKTIINSDDTVVFMKGNAHFPQCGFSANTAKILDSFAKEYTTFDILKAPEVRQAIKEFSNWPTFPQLYVKGKLIGGNDIITEMFQSGDLKEVIV